MKRKSRTLSNPRETAKRVSVYSSDSIKVTLKGYSPFSQPVPHGTNVEGAFFDGYPQLVKREESKPTYKVRVEKDIMVAMRDGVRIAVDVYRPDVDVTWTG